MQTLLLTKRIILLIVLATCYLFGDEPKICLTMIVKNESKIIERCLNSVKDIVDYISISDTGSTDNTVQILEDFLRKNQIPGKIYKDEWKNFGHNRTLSFQRAKQTLNDLGIKQPNIYLLLIDADMMLKIGKDFSKSNLMEDCYMLLQKTENLSHFNVRLLKANLPWECIGVTHEYWSTQFPHSTGKLNSLSIEDLNDGGSKSQKFERDIALLTQGLKDEPENVRYMFYLAQSYRVLREYDKAIKWYKSRIEKGGWKEEVWFSKLMIGECYEEMNYWDHALHWYLEAYQFNPKRAEPLKKIATHYRNEGQNQLAYLFAKQGSNISYPKDEVLFISHPVYDYQFDEEISIAAYYTPFKQEGFQAINRLLLKKNIPQNIKEQSYKNLLFYLENIKNAHFIPLEIDLPLIREGTTEKYYVMNPTIKKINNGYATICRTINFTHNQGKDYHSRDPLDKTIRTRNFFVLFDSDFKIKNQKEIVENLPRNRVPSKVEGLEDCRLFSMDGDYWFIGTSFDIKPNYIMQSLCKLSNDQSNQFIKVEKLIPLQGPKQNKCEKNWLPFVINNSLYAIYSSDPLTLYKIDSSSGRCEITKSYQNNYDFSRFRGSAGPIEFDKGYLMLIHEVIFNDNRTYTHRFVYLDNNFNITKVSKPFTFLHKGVEYCCGMTIDHSGKNCVLTIGVEDKEAYFCILDLKEIQMLLEDLP